MSQTSRGSDTVYLSSVRYRWYVSSNVGGIGACDAFCLCLQQRQTYCRSTIQDACKQGGQGGIIKGPAKPIQQNLKMDHVRLPTSLRCSLRSVLHSIAHLISSVCGHSEPNKRVFPFLGVSIPSTTLLSAGRRRRGPRCRRFCFYVQVEPGTNCNLFCRDLHLPSFGRASHITGFPPLDNAFCLRLSSFHNAIAQTNWRGTAQAQIRPSD